MENYNQSQAMENSRQSEKARQLKSMYDDISSMQSTPGWKYIEHEIQEEINRSFMKTFAGTKEDFDYAKGYNRGVNYVFNWLKGLKSKIQQYEKEKR